MGKTADEAISLYHDALELQEAGAIAVELECVPYRVAAEITKRLKMLTFSMGSGAGCDGYYLFSCDLLGTHDGHYPRHSITYNDFFDQSIEAFRKFENDVKDGTFPAKKNMIEIKNEQLEIFMDEIEKL